MTEKILIEELRELDAKLFSALDLSFASFVCRAAGEEDNYSLFLAAALVSNASVKRKYTCLDIKELSGSLNDYFSDLNDFETKTDEIRKSLQKFPIPENWRENLRSLTKAVSIPIMGEVEFVPLVLDESLLYVYRDWICEQGLAKAILQRCELENELGESEISGISNYFKPMTEDKPDWQQIAVLAASRQNLTVVSGAPGTGKTTVAAAVSAMFLEQNPDTKITLCAPTGKAQARLQESIMAQIPNLNCTETTKERLQNLAIATIHRLLGGRPGTPRFRYNRNHKLVLDVLIVDEASMISQSLMKALFEAIPSSAKLIMLGDMQQLASVESGMVLRDFCLAAKENDILSGNVIELKENHRFASDRGLGLTTAEIRALPEKPSLVDAEKIVDEMRADASGEIDLQELPPWLKHEFKEKINSYLEKVIVDFEGVETAYLSFRNEKNVMRAYELFNKFRVICVYRSGLYGSEVINNIIEQLVMPQTTSNRQSFYHGKPIIINENNYAMDLFNGDTGIVWTDEKGCLKAFFPSSDINKQDFRSFDLNLLPAFSSAYAITVHKAQGSGFQQVLIITPSELSPLMTREMIYTALSRAEKRAVLWTNTKILSEALQSLTKRHSNLRDCLSQKQNV
ncbi:MAG: exodeoxyribonuclease V subunit alpha [Victivallales bacterium]|nr:exodeoxyribonuclease V subunit alpha [Victivallales bacterium]